MGVYLKLPGYSGTAQRPGYRHWVEIESVSFERPLLEKDPAEFSVHKALDALSRVFTARAASGRAFTRLRLHRVEGSDAFMKLRFDKVRVKRVEIDGAAEQAMERITFVADRWQFE